MSRVHVFIKPFKDTSGNYADDFIEVSADVIDRSLGELKQRLDHSEYDIGVIRNSNVRLKLQNDAGQYNDVGDPGSIFVFKRSDSIVKITWEPGEGPLVCGFFKPITAQLSTEITLFEGLLEDTAEKASVDDQVIDFNVLGYESILDREIVPFATISNGDSLESIIFDSLNQSAITALLTVSAGNINLTTNTLIDDKTSLENKTVLEMLKEVLLLGNGVMHLTNTTTINIAPRTPAAASSFTFFGQAATGGVENIAAITNFRSGLNRTFNHWTWKDSSVVSQDVSSISKFGIRKREISSDLVSLASTAKIQAILDSLKAEFGNPREEMMLTAPLEVAITGVIMLDRVTIDYPEIPIVSSDEALATYGIAQYGVAQYADTLSNFSIDSSRSWKVLSRGLRPESDLAKYHLREII